MIHRKWSLLSSTLLIWGGVATAGLAGVLLLHAKEKYQEYLNREGDSLRQQDRAMMANAKKSLTNSVERR